MPKISVIVPIYNQEKYLKTCLDSICDQTFKDMEIICVDDGSTDATSDILNEYSLKDNRIKVIRQENQYAGVARNTGMKYASGKYWIFLDSDDYFDVSMLEKMYTRAEETLADIVLCEYCNFSDLTKEVFSYDFKRERTLRNGKNVFSGTDLKDNAIFQITQGWPWDKLFRADFVKKCGYIYPNIRSSEDGFFVLMLLAKAENLAFVSEILVYHRIFNKNSLSFTKEKNWENGFIMLESVANELKEQGLYEIYEKSLLNFWLDFEVAYLESMNTFDAYKKTYERICQYKELNDRILELLVRDCYYPQAYEFLKEVLAVDLDQYLFNCLKNKKMFDVQRKNSSSQKGWIFPYKKIKKNMTVVLYGAGKIGRQYFEQLTYTQYCKKLYWVDKKFDSLVKTGIPVDNPAIINKVGVDYVIIAILNDSVQEEIRNELLRMGIKREQIICVS